MFTFLRNAWATEPARVITWAGGLITAIFTALTAFGVTFTGDQQDAISGLFGAFTAIFVGGGEVVRSQVRPVKRSAAWPDARDRGQSDLTAVLITVLLVVVLIVVLFRFL